MESWHLWIIAGVFLITLEMLTPGFFLALIGLAALIASLGAKMGLAGVWQIALFVSGSALMLAVVRPMVWSLRRSSDPTPTNVPALVGKTGVVTEPGAGPSSPARVKIGSEEWRAFAPDYAELPAGAFVTVTRVDGSTLTVRVNPSSV